MFNRQKNGFTSILYFGFSVGSRIGRVRMLDFGLLFRMMVKLFIFFGCSLAHTSFLFGEDLVPSLPSRKAPPLESSRDLFHEGSIIDQVLMESQTPKIYDWRNSQYQLDLGIENVNEGNVFPSKGWRLGAGFSLGGGVMLRTGLKRIEVASSPPGKMLEKTPFRQYGQPNRWELYGIGSYSLLEGRTSSRLSPWISDTESVFSAEAGLHYVYPSQRWLSKRKDEKKRLEGQTLGYSLLVLNLGLRYQVFLPSGVGIYFEGMYQLPLKKIDASLGSWNSFSVGTVFSFGKGGRL